MRAGGVDSGDEVPFHVLEARYAEDSDDDFSHRAAQVSGSYNGCNGDLNAGTGCRMQSDASAGASAVSHSNHKMRLSFHFSGQVNVMVLSCRNIGNGDAARC